VLPSPTVTLAPLTPTSGPACSSLQPPTSFGEGFVDLTTAVETDLIPVATPAPNAQPTNSYAFFSDIDGDGIMEVFVSQDSSTAPTLLRYDPSSGKLSRDTAAILPSFDKLYGVIDLDSDGIPDLFGHHYGRPNVAWGLGGGAFAERVDVFPDRAG